MYDDLGDLTVTSNKIGSTLVAIYTDRDIVGTLHFEHLANINPDLSGVIRDNVTNLPAEVEIAITTAVDNSVPKSGWGSWVSARYLSNISGGL